MFPADLSGASVERDDVSVHGGEINHIVVDRESLRSFDATERRILEFALVLPDQIAVRGVERVDDAARRNHVHHSIVDDRDRFRYALAQSAHPGHAKLADVFLVDLLERAVAKCVVRPAVHKPVVRTGIQEHLLRDGLVILDLRGNRRNRRYNRAHNKSRKSGHASPTGEAPRNEHEIEMPLRILHHVSARSQATTE